MDPVSKALNILMLRTIRRQTTATETCLRAQTADPVQRCGYPSPNRGVAPTKVHNITFSPAGTQHPINAIQLRKHSAALKQLVRPNVTRIHEDRRIPAGALQPALLPNVQRKRAGAEADERPGFCQHQEVHQRLRLGVQRGQLLGTQDLLLWCDNLGCDTFGL